jgi:hypothetical protein
MELLLGIAPLNQLDASASPIDIFQPQPDMTPYKAIVPKIALNNLLVKPAADRETAKWIRESERLDFSFQDLANPDVLNRIIWFSVRGETTTYPMLSHVPAYDVIRTVTNEEALQQIDIDRQIKMFLAKRTTNAHNPLAKSE